MDLDVREGALVSPNGKARAVCFCEVHILLGGSGFTFNGWGEKGQIELTWTVPHYNEDKTSELWANLGSIWVHTSLEGNGWLVGKVGGRLSREYPIKIYDKDFYWWWLIANLAQDILVQAQQGCEARSCRCGQLLRSTWMEGAHAMTLDSRAVGVLAESGLYETWPQGGVLVKKWQFSFIISDLVSNKGLMIDLWNRTGVKTEIFLLNILRCSCRISFCRWISQKPESCWMRPTAPVGPSCPVASLALWLTINPMLKCFGLPVPSVRIVLEPLTT